MPPTTRRTVSEPSSPPNHNLQFSLFGPSHIPISPVTSRTRRPHSSSSSPYPTSRTAIEQARTSSRSADSTRRILGEIDWWVVMSGQREENEDEYDYEEEEEEEEWETMPVEDTQPVEDTTPSVPVDTISHNDQDEDDTISEHSDSEASVHSDVTLSGYEASAGEDEPEERVSSLFFPTTFPPLANLLSSQVGSEPSRRASRSPPNNRPYTSRPSTSTLTWDYSTSSMMVTSVTPPSPPPPPGRSTACRSSPRRSTSVGIAQGSVADNIIRDALALTSPSPSPGPTKTNMNFLTLKKFPMASLMVSPSILTFR